MISDPETVASKLRWLPGIQDIEIVQFPSGKELWAVLREPLDLQKLHRASERRGYRVAKRGSLSSRLPRSLAEMVWDGVMYVITEDAGGSKRSQPVGRVLKDLVTGKMIFHAKDGDGLAILEDYLKN